MTSNDKFARSHTVNFNSVGLDRYKSVESYGVEKVDEENEDDVLSKRSKTHTTQQL